LPYGFWSHDTVRIHRHIGHCVALLSEVRAGIQYGRMFNLRRHQMAPTSLEHCRHTLEDRIIGLCATAAEKNGRRRRTKHISHTIACVVNGHTHSPAIAVHTRWITKILTVVTQQDLQHFWQDRCGSVMIEIHLTHKE